MRDKSKFIVFILSFIPGLAHLYIGLKDRAFIFLGMLGAGIFGTIVLRILTYSNTVFGLFMLGYGFLWLIALLDVFSALKALRRRYYENNNYENNNNENHEIPYINKEEVEISNKRSTAMAFSIIPGAGHMYLGYQKKGLMIMGAFFFSIFFMGWLGISLLLFLLPLIWFYSFFDTMHSVNGNYEGMEDQKFELPNIKPQWIGYSLIGIGIIIILERILYPLIEYEIRRYIQTSIVSLIFIIIGVFILKKNSESNTSIEDINEEDEIDED